MLVAAKYEPREAPVTIASLPSYGRAMVVFTVKYIYTCLFKKKNQKNNQLKKCMRCFKNACKQVEIRRRFYPGRIYVQKNPPPKMPRGAMFPRDGFSIECSAANVVIGAHRVGFVS